MTELPRALSAWAPELAVFPRDVALALGGSVARVAAAFGPVAAATASPVGELDGFDGIARRGSLAHLVPAEWALADALPDEFLRRATSGEQVFFRLRRREPAIGRAAFALFDAGPWQIGSPRVAQFAVLIVLAQRARAARVPFRWGILQQLEPRWTEGVSAAGIGRLQRATTGQLATAEHLAAWREALARESTAGDLWLVGDAALRELARDSAAVVAIEDRIERVEPGGRVVDVTCDRFRTPGGRLALPLPEPATAVRLLRDPFETAAAPPHSALVGWHPRVFLSSGARKLIVLRADGALVMFAVGNSPRATIPPPLTFTPPSGEVVVATEWHAGRWRIVTQRGSTFTTHTIARGGGSIVPPVTAMLGASGEPPADGGLSPLVRWPDGTERFAHPGGLGIVLREATATAMGAVRAIAYSGGELWWVAEGDNRMLFGGEGPISLPTAGDGRTFFGCLPAKGICLLAVRTGDGEWSVHSENKRIRLRSGPSQVFGVVDGPALFACEPDARSPLLMGVSFTQRLPALAEPVTVGCACTSAPYIAYASDEGEIRVYSLKTQKTVLHVISWSNVAIRPELDA
jgi:hypothetical protein